MNEGRPKSTNHGAYQAASIKLLELRIEGSAQFWSDRQLGKNPEIWLFPTWRPHVRNLRLWLPLDPWLSAALRHHIDGGTFLLFGLSMDQVHQSSGCLTILAWLLWRRTCTLLQLRTRMRQIYWVLLMVFVFGHIMLVNDSRMDRSDDGVADDTSIYCMENV